MWVRHESSNSLWLLRVMKKQIWHSEIFLLCPEERKDFSDVGCTSCKTMCLINNAFCWKGMGGLLRYDSSLSVAVIKSVACLEVSMTLFILIFQSLEKGGPYLTTCRTKAECTVPGCKPLCTQCDQWWGAGSKLEAESFNNVDVQICQFLPLSVGFRLRWKMWFYILFMCFFCNLRCPQVSCLAWSPAGVSGTCVTASDTPEHIKEHWTSLCKQPSWAPRLLNMEVLVQLQLQHPVVSEAKCGQWS